MANYTKGMDPQAVLTSAEALAGMGKECSTIAQQSSTAISQLSGQWGGSDLQALIAKWGPVREHIEGLGETFEQLAERLRHNAQAQQTASGSGGVGAGIGAFAGASATGSAVAGAGAVANGEVPIARFGPEGAGKGPSLGDIRKAVDMGLGAKDILGTTVALTAIASQWDKGASLLANLKTYDTVADFKMAMDVIDGKGWGQLAADSAGKSVSELGAFGKTVNVAGKALGVAGVGLAAWDFGSSLYDGFKDGWTAEEAGKSAKSGVSLGLAAGAAFAPPPANLACGIAGLGILAYDNIPAVKDFVDGGVEVAKDVGGAIADGAENAWDEVSSWF